MRTLLTALCFAAVSASPLLAQHGARDAFWSASDLVSVSANPGTHTTPAAPVRRRPAPAAESRTPHVDPLLVAKNGYGEQPHFVRVSNDQIGLRYSVLLRDAQGAYQEVTPGTVFHSGDYLHLSVMANQPGYLYVIQQGSSGSWSPIFPRKGSAADSNKVEAGVNTEVPSGKQAFQFDSTPGEEKLFIVVSRRPIEDFDKTIEGLKGGGAHNTVPASAHPDMSVYEASNRIPDELIKRFASRDLALVETTDGPDKKADSAETKVAGLDKNITKEKAVYVVSKGTVTSGGPQVVASLTLRHN